MREIGSIRWRTLVVVTAVALLLASAARAQDAKQSAAGDDATKLAEEAQNPVANLISVPFQNNFNSNTGTKDATQWILLFPR